MRAYFNQLRPFSSIRHVAVAIGMVHEGQQHIGILHAEDVQNTVKLVHLAWHNKLKESEPKDGYLWIDPPIPSPRARQVAARCRQILRANEKEMPYAFSPPNDCFDVESGRFLFGPTRHGLTCAAFVLAVFDSAGIRMADYGSWPDLRPDDRQWQQYIIDQLEKSGASPEHVTSVRREAGNVRYRPEDVAGCAASDQLPCPFNIAQPLGHEIVNQLKQFRKNLSDS